ncbi:inorganic diphosphatase [Thermomicrobiaceae bacterium CFH 74404]|uniref:inorganic diphosphatase n=1 Tax=Thermalbibacter longus TaxID=2951981 RepID=A0AA41WAI1_9BACT|nr:inorganic diphosphatase [Thermalbibacter longus]MCM8748736.1 inorganic diphosphatase [Thermalbibacter longus]
MSEHRLDAGDCLEAVIEDPAGSTVRHARDQATGTWTTYRHPHARRPWPAAYGHLPGTYNPIDDDALDVIVLSSMPLRTGQRVRVRPIGVFVRPDGDHKVLAVRCNDPRYGGVVDLLQAPAEDLRAIEEWFADWDIVLGWESAEVAWQLIRSATGARDEPL